MRGLSKRVTAFLESLSQECDMVEHDIALLEETMSRYSEVQAYWSDLVVIELRKDKGAAARNLTNKRRRICVVEDNMKGVEKAISLLD